MNEYSLQLFVELCLCYFNYDYVYVYAILFWRPHLSDNIDTEYTMLDPAFDKGHRARFIENGVMITMLLEPNLLN